MRRTRREFLTLTAGLAGLLAACAPSARTNPPTAAPATRAQGRSDRTLPSGKPVDLWNGPGLDARVLFQQEVDRLPEAPYMLRVTELEMAPGATIDPRTHLGPGVQIVLSGAFTLIDGQTNQETVYEPTPAVPYPIFYTGVTWRYGSANRAASDNRLFMVEVLPRSRGFLGNQQFDTDGVTHNQGGVRSGPYLQIPIEQLPDPPLMVRVTQIDMGPKARSPEYTRPGPAVFFVASGQGTFRNQDKLRIATNGAGGYFFEDGIEPSLIENKPITPNRVIAVEFLPASLGKQPSTVPTGRDVFSKPDPSQ